MQPVSLKKRLLLYLTVLLPINIIATSCITIHIALGYGEVTYIVFSFLIMYYIFGAIFLKARLEIKVIVPLPIALISYLSSWLMLKFNLFFEIFGGWDFIIQIFLFSVIVWEIAYQMLRYFQEEN